MREGIKKDLVLERVKGDTWCIVTGSGRIPLYLKDRQNAVMIDSGLKRPDREPLLALLDKEEIHITSLLTSHFHRDHVGNHKTRREKYGCKIYMSPYTEAVCGDSINLKSGGYESFFMAKARGGSFSCPADEIILRTDETVCASGAEFKILHLPGHAQEQMGFVTPDGVAYLADTILTEDLLRAVRIPYCTYCMKDLEAKASVLEMHYDVYILAHNGVVPGTEIHALAEKNIRNMHEKIDMVEGLLMEKPLTLEELAIAAMKKTGGDLTNPVKVFGAQRNVQVVLEYLMETERVVLRLEEGFLKYISVNA